MADGKDDGRASKEGWLRRQCNGKEKGWERGMRQRFGRALAGGYVDQAKQPNQPPPIFMLGKLVEGQYF